MDELRKLLAKLAEKRKAALAAASALIDKAKTETRDLTDEERTAWDGHLAEADAVKADIDRTERQLKAAEEQDALERSLNGPARTIPRPNPGGGAPAPKTTEDRPYSLMRAIRSMLPNLGSVDAKVEQRASDEIRERLGKDPNGLFVPYRSLLPSDVEQRVVAKASPNTTGAAGIAVDLMPDELVELLRNEAKVVMAGARMLPNLVGDVDIPRQSAGASAAFLANEDTAVAESSLTLNKISLTPKVVGLKSTITRRMLIQDSVGIEELVRGDQRAAIGLAIDSAAINGSGAGGNPTGILNTGGIGGVTTAGAVARSHLIEFETDLGAANALRGRLGFMTRSAVCGILKAKVMATNTAVFMMADDGTIVGYPTQVTEQVPANTLIFGNWAEVLIGMWGGLDMFADPYSVGDKGHVVIRGFQDIDIGIRHAASFSAATDLTA